MRRARTLAALGMLVLAAAGCAHGPGGKGPRMGPDHTPGWQMMNQAERDEHHRRMMAARTPEDCRRVMDEHRKRMQERADAHGMKMPGPRHDACAGMRP